MIITIALLVSLFIKRIASACSAGCLRCTTDDHCQACEIWANYYLDTGSCVKKTLANCQLISQSGGCLICSPSYFFDVTTKACAAVPNDFKVANCDVYNSDLSCKYCSNSTYFKSGNCTVVDTKIPDCLYYSSGSVCQVCQPGKVLTSAADACVSPQKPDPNCAAFSGLKCRACASNYLLTPNQYIATAMTSIDFGTSLILSQFKNNANAISPIVCAAQNIANCLVYKDLFNCLQCRDGFYLASPLSCLPFPKQVIDNCAAYSSDNICSDCQQGYFLSKPDLCKAVVEVSNCTLYATNQPQTTCVRCQPLFYVNSLGACMTRIFSQNITNCTLVDFNSDRCANCSEKMSLTDDGLRCLSWPENCEETAPTTFESNQFVCQRCQQKYFLDSSTGKCKEGSVANCLEYQRTSNDCALCADGFYFNNTSTCSSHSAVVNCLSYNPFVPNTCSQCKIGALLFAHAKVCLPVATAIPGCLVYLNETNCSVCDDGYQLSQGLCSAIDSGLNCLRQATNGSCLKCRPGFTLNSGLCSLPFAFITDNCQTSNLGSGLLPLSSANCLVCNEGSYPSSYQNHFLCMENSLVSARTGSDFASCRMVAFSANAYSCYKCPAGKVMDTTGACVDACPSQNALNLYLIEGTTDAYYPSKELYCTTDSSCQLKSMNNQPATTDVTMTCAACGASFANVTNPNTDVSVGQRVYDPGNGLTVPAAPVLFLPAVTCLSSQSLVNLNPGGSAVVDNCEFYFTFSSRTGCLKCKHGYFGTLADDNLNNSFIKTCAKLTTCDDTIFYAGLSKNVNSVASCHKCTELTKIPFVFIDGGSPYNDLIGLNTYSFANTQAISATTGGVTVDCLTLNSTYNSYALSSLPSNCGLGFIRVASQSRDTSDAAKESGIDRSKIGAFCVACAPGYRPSAQAFDNAATPALVKHMVPKCVSIPNCQSSSWFNYCSNCQDGFAYGYKPTTGVQYDSCVQFAQDPNCFAVNVANPLSLSCAFCDKGYTKNEDGLCVQRSPPRCKEGKFVAKRTFLRIDFNTLLFLRPGGEGCTECEDGFKAVQVSSQILVCTASNYVATNLFPSPTAFIPNCKLYGFDASGVVSCSQCKTDFVIDTTKLNCYAGASLKNCAVAYGPTVCNSCSGNFIVVAGKCESKKIPHCKIFVENKDSVAQVCSQCADGFFFQSANCVPGNVAFCALYGSSLDDCRSCQPGYQLLYKSDNKLYCYPIDPALFCLRYKDTDFAQGVLTCLECATNQYVLGPPKASQPQSICMPFQQIDSCLEYVVGAQSVYSSFNCRECQVGFFIADGKCQARNNSVSNCAEYDPAADLCTSCANSTFLAPDGQSCQPWPNGISGCRLYLNETSCLSCKSNFYFNVTQQKCVVVDTASLAANCLYYSQLAKCDSCLEGYVLSATKTCEPAIAKNCLTFDNKTACASCGPGKGLKNETGVINCVSISDVNCESYELLFPFKCLVCKPGTILSAEGLCKPVAHPVKDCLRYSGDSACSSCQPGLVLTNATSCITNSALEALRDPNCVDAASDGSYVCMVCKEGFWFNDMQCVACKIAGCHFCDPLNSGLCVMCQAGYFMDKNGTCNVVPSGGTQQSNQTDVKFAGVLEVLRLLAVFGCWLAFMA